MFHLEILPFSRGQADHLCSSGETPNPSGFPLNAHVGILGTTSLMLNRVVDERNEKIQQKCKRKRPKHLPLYFSTVRRTKGGLALTFRPVCFNSINYFGVFFSPSFFSLAAAPGFSGRPNPLLTSQRRLLFIHESLRRDTPTWKAVEL